mgnify:CR=1 FL=1
MMQIITLYDINKKKSKWKNSQNTDFDTCCCYNYNYFCCCCCCLLICGIQHNIVIIIHTHTLKSHRILWWKTKTKKHPSIFFVGCFFLGYHIWCFFLVFFFVWFIFGHFFGLPLSIICGVVCLQFNYVFSSHSAKAFRCLGQKNSIKEQDL